MEPKEEEGRGLDVAMATGFVKDGVCVQQLLQLFQLLINMQNFLSINRLVILSLKCEIGKNATMS